jgi:hypothetical protein
MHGRLGARGLGIATWLISLAACSSSSTTCICDVALGSERRVLACGQSACLAGVTVSCIQKDTSVQRGACTAPPTPPPSDSATTAPPTNADFGASCQDLQSFCELSCAAPASALADCLATASAGDPAACEGWVIGSGVACHP